MTDADQVTRAITGRAIEVGDRVRIRRVALDRDTSLVGTVTKVEYGLAWPSYVNAHIGLAYVDWDNGGRSSCYTSALRRVKDGIA